MTVVQCSKMKKELIFVLDPMCSWCWGFTPVMEQLHITHSDCYDFSLVVGGLRTKGEMIWDASSKGYLKGHWEQVANRTGQSFSNALFEKEDFIYDTYPACKAVVTIRELFGMQSAFEYLHLIQERFYTQGEDITNQKFLTDLVRSIDLETEAFKLFYESDRAELLMRHDFAKARSMGANAFPSVVVIDKDGHMVCQKDYLSLLEIKKLLESEYA